MSARFGCLDEPVSPAVIRSLRDRLDLLEEENRQLREAAEALVVFPRSWGLAEMEVKFLSALMRSRTGCLSKEALLTALYGLEWDVQEKIIDVWACKVRKKLAATGLPLQVRTVWGRGYELPSEARAELVAALEELDGRAADRFQTDMQATIDRLTAQVDALQAENDRLQSQREMRADGPVAAASEKGWRRFAKTRPARRAPVLVIRGGRHGR